MKKVLETVGIILVGSAILIGVFLFVARDKREENIRNFVNKNYKTLVVTAKDQLEGKNIELPEKVESVNVYDNNYVEFSISGKEGFYYSKNDKPMAHQNKSEDLIELGNNKYKWNNGITNKIRKNWYYYKVDK